MPNGLEPGLIRAFADGRVYVADAGDADVVNFPASIAAPIPAGWQSAGVISEDGVKFNFGREVVEKYGWQSEDPFRILTTRKPKDISFTCLEFGPVGLGLACGGIYVTTDAAGAFRIHPQSERFVDYRAILIDGEDDDFHYRFGYRRSLNQSNVEFSLVRKDTTDLPIQLKVLKPLVGEPWFIQTNDEVWADLADDPS